MLSLVSVCVCLSVCLEPFEISSSNLLPEQDMAKSSDEFDNGCNLTYTVASWSYNCRGVRVAIDVSDGQVKNYIQAEQRPAGITRIQRPTAVSYW